MCGHPLLITGSGRRGFCQDPVIAGAWKRGCPREAVDGDMAPRKAGGKSSSHPNVLFSQPHSWNSTWSWRVREPRSQSHGAQSRARSRARIGAQDDKARRCARHVLDAKGQMNEVSPRPVALYVLLDLQKARDLPDVVLPQSSQWWVLHSRLPPSAAPSCLPPSRPQWPSPASADPSGTPQEHGCHLGRNGAEQELFWTELGHYQREGVKPWDDSQNLKYILGCSEC